MLLLYIFLQDNKLALQGYHDCFMTIDPEDDAVLANVKKAGPDQFVQIRSQTQKEDNPLSDVPSEEQGNIRQIEINYV